MDPAALEDLPQEGDVGPDGRDLSIQQWLEDREQERKQKEEEEGKGVTVVEYTPVDPKRLPIKRFAVIILVSILVIAALYAFVIPRADAELVIQYNESIMGGINVDARIENHGTREMTDVRVTILVQDSADARMSDPSVFEGIVASHDEAGMDTISFPGDQWDTYHIFVEWSFECAGKEYAGSEHYETKGNAMNVWFTENLTP
jgi:hypothetical protein